MLQRRFLPDDSAVPGRRFRLVIEDPVLARDRALVQNCELPFDVRVCAGPRSAVEACPLVTEGRCPLGPADAVVTSLEGPWARCVGAAWREDGVPVVEAPEAGAAEGRAPLDRAVAAAMAVVAPAGPPVGSG